MATLLSQNQNPPPPPAYIQAAAPCAAAAKWYDSNRSWGEYWQQWENYFDYFKKTELAKVHKHYPNQLPDKSDNLPYDHATPFGVDPNDPSKPYAPHGFYCDENGNPTMIPFVTSEEIFLLKNAIEQDLDATNPASLLNVYNVSSPMDPYNMQQFFYPEKPGSPWHQYEREPYEIAPAEKEPTEEENDKWNQPELPRYIHYPDSIAAFEDTPENFPWLHDQDPSHHYRYDLYYKSFQGSELLSSVVITEKIYLDSPVAPVGWKEVVPLANTTAQ